uniref:Uncharacterized protein n=1 Tax=Arundo donax TaxID=35708 RepID=A0A0A9FT52_ARUDO
MTITVFSATETQKKPPITSSLNAHSVKGAGIRWA